MTPLGAIVVDELIVPITDVQLRDGMIHLTARLGAPFPARGGGAYVVTGSDGSVIFRSDRADRGLVWDAKTGADDVLVVELPLSINDRVAAIGARS